MGFKTLLFQRIDMGWFGSSNKKEKSKATGGYPSQGGGYPTQNNASSNVQEKQTLPQQMPPLAVPPVSSWTPVTVSPTASPSTRVTLSPTPSSVWTWLAVSSPTT